MIEAGKTAFFFLALLPCLTCPPAQAQDRPILAVFDIEDRGANLETEALANLSEYLSIKLVECGYQVIPNAQIKELLVAEKKNSYRECYDQTCQVALGRELAAQKMLSSRLLKIGTGCKLTSALYDLSRSAAEQAASASSECGEEALIAPIEEIAAQLCAALAANRETQARASEKAASDFEQALRGAQKIRGGKERVRQAWIATSQIAGDPLVPIATRAELVKKFLTEFEEENPYAAQAQGLLSELLPATLVVETDPPGAMALLNESTIGQTPLVRRVKAGSYRVSAVLTGFSSESQKVNLEPGQETRVRLAMTDERQSTLVVSTFPTEAKVEITRGTEFIPADRSPKGIPLDAGTYEIAASAEGYVPQKKQVTLKHGVKTEVELTLKAIPPGRLVVKTEPPGALARLRQVGDRSSLSKTSPLLDLGTTPLETKLLAGRYKVEALLDGYEDAGQVVDIRSATSNEISLSLVRIYPMNPYKKWGHVAFWGGLGLAAFGGVSAVVAKSAAEDDWNGDASAADRSRTWAGLMYTGLGVGGAGLITGIVLWALSPGDKEWFDQREAALSVEPGSAGATISASWKW
jgi:hypothetical protein